MNPLSNDVTSFLTQMPIYGTLFGFVRKALYMQHWIKFHIHPITAHETDRLLARPSGGLSILYVPCRFLLIEVYKFVHLDKRNSLYEFYEAPFMTIFLKGGNVGKRGTMCLNWLDIHLNSEL